MGFSSAQYLHGLGWQGEGTGLRKGALAKPITVAQKKTLAGVGKDRDTSFAWWEMLFHSVANKSKSASASTESSGSATPSVSSRLLLVSSQRVRRGLSTSTFLVRFPSLQHDTQRRTTTGILSHRPPPSGSSTPTSVPSGAVRSSGDPLADARREAVRRQLYSSFMRRSVIEGSEDAGVAPATAPAEASASTSTSASASSQATPVVQEPAAAGTSAAVERAEDEKAARKERKCKRKAERELKESPENSSSARKKAKKREDTSAPLPTPPPEDDQEASAATTVAEPSEEEERKEEKARRKAERRALRKEQKRQDKRLATAAESTAAAATAAASAPTSTTKAPSSGSAVLSQGEAQAAKAGDSDDKLAQQARVAAMAAYRAAIGPA